MRYNSRYGKNRGKTEKASNRKKTLLRLWGYLTRYHKRLIFGFVLMILANVLALIGPFLIGGMLDLIDQNEPLNTIIMMGLVLVGFYLVSAVLNYLLSNALVRISQRVARSLRYDLFKKITNIEVKYFDANQTGDIIARMGYDIDQVTATLATDIMSFFVSIITVVVSFTMMVIISIYLSSIFFIMVPITILITRYLSKIIRRKLRARNEQLGILNGFSEEMISGYQTIQAYVQQDSIYDLFEKTNLDTRDKMYEAGKNFTIVGPTVNFINNLSMSLVGVIGAIIYVFDLITIGGFGSFMLYSRRFSGPINQMSNLVADIQSALAAAERVFYVLDQPSEKEDINYPLASVISKGDIKFRNINFGYLDELVLKDVSFELASGKTLAIVGKTGSGKTTIINLLLRFYELNEGNILLDDNEIGNYARTNYRRKYAMILQEGFLFKGSIYENVKYGTNATLDEVIEACKLAQVHDDIMKLSRGYDTIISGDSMRLSKGQQQLLSIARSFLSNSQILIYDEATSSVDTNTEILIQEAVNRLMKDRSSIIIAHRLSTIKNADDILLIDHGRIIERGSHQELLALKGEYYSLYSSQFE